MARGNALAKQRFLGQWRIVAMELWAAEDLDLVGPAHLTLERNGLGRLGFLAIEAGLDYRVGERDDGPAPWNSPSRDPTRAAGSPGAAGPLSRMTSFGVAYSFIAAMTPGLRHAGASAPVAIESGPHEANTSARAT
jgi:hypothetical protein